MSKIPELREYVQRYGRRLNENPAFILVGSYKSLKIGAVAGILAAASNEFHAYILKREIDKAGKCTIEKTEYHPTETTLSIKIYREQHNKKMKELKNKKENL